MSNGPRTVKILHDELIRPAARISRHATSAKSWRAHRPRPSPWRGIKDQVMENTKFGLDQLPASVRGREQLAFVLLQSLKAAVDPARWEAPRADLGTDPAVDTWSQTGSAPRLMSPFAAAIYPGSIQGRPSHPAFRVRTGEGRRRADVAYGEQRGGTHHIDQRVSGGKWVTCCWMMCLR